jgi:hypothetical protein
MKPAFPNLASAVAAWMQPLEFVLVGKEMVDHILTETYITKRTFGVRAPLKPQELALKPEGQRAWRWEKIHALPSLKLNVDDIIKFGELRYRVMGKADYSEYGYLEYEIAEGFDL